MSKYFDSDLTHIYWTQFKKSTPKLIDWNHFKQFLATKLTQTKRENTEDKIKQSSAKLSRDVGI